jgi:D-alanine transaminase
LMWDLAKRASLPMEIRKVRRREVRAADEVWIMSSTKEVVPIVSLDDKPIANGAPGPMFKKMYQLFQDYKRSLPAAPSLAAAAE